MRRFCTFLALLVMAGAGRTAEPTIDLTRAVVVTPTPLALPEQTAVRMLIEEVEKRTMLRWDRAEKWPGDGTPVIVVGPAAGVRSLLAGHGVDLPNQPVGREGFRIGVTAGKSPVVWVAGDDARGTLY